MSDNTGGRPTIGRQVSVTLPEDVLEAVKEMAVKAGTTRGGVLREIVIAGVRDRTRLGDISLSALLAPAAETLAMWVSSGQDEKTVVGRFALYKGRAGNPFHLAKILQTAYGSLTLSGIAAPLPSPEALDLVTGRGHDGWRARTILFFQVLNALMEQGVKIHDDEDGGEIGFGPKPEEIEEDYA